MTSNKKALNVKSQVRHDFQGSMIENNLNLENFLRDKERRKHRTFL